MKKLSLLLFFLAVLAISCTAQSLKWYPISYKADFTDSTKFVKPIRYMGTLLTPTAAEINILHSSALTAAELGYLHGVTSAVQTQIAAKEPSLGNPGVSGYVLSSTTGGVRSWVAQGAGGGTGTVTSVAVTSSGGISATVDNATTTPTMTFSLGNIVPNQVNGVRVASGGSTPVITVTGTSSISGANTGDNAVNSLYSSLVTNATHTGDVTGSTALTVKGINSVLLSSLGTGLFKNTTGTGVPSIATAGVDYLTPSGSAASLTNFPTLNQATTANAGTATKWATARHINGVLVDGTADVSIPTDLTPGAAGNIPMSNGAGALVMDTPVDISTLIPTPGTAGNIQTSDGAGHWVSAANSSSTAGSIPEAASNPTTGNIYINTVDKKIHYLSGGYWHRVAIIDSTAASASPSTLLNELVGYWKFDETSGTNLADATAGANNATLVVGTVNQTGKIGKAVTYNNTGYATVPYAAFSAITDKETISFWFYPTSLPSTVTRAEDLFAHQIAGTDITSKVFWYMDNVIYAKFENTSDVFYQVQGSAAITTLNTWYHVVAVCPGNGQALKLYINDVDVSTYAGTFSGTLKVSTAPAVIANDEIGDNYGLVGTLDELGIWRRGLSASGVDSVYVKENAGTSYPF